MPFECEFYSSKDIDKLFQIVSLEQKSQQNL